MLEISIPSGARRLAARLFQPDPSRSGSTGALLFLHGHGSNQVGYGPRAEEASRTLA
jgi:hypothetical protein